MEELERLKDQMQAVEMSIAKAVSDGTLIMTSHTDPFPSGNVYS
jgi:RecJ-like exonuclease